MSANQFNPRVRYAVERALNLPVAMALGASLLLAACASTPPIDPELENARAAVATLETDPMAAQSAGKPLQDARDALAAANSAAQQHHSQVEVDHLAYLARRRAEIGEAVLAEARSRNELAQAQERRDRILIESRERETAAAREQTRDAQAQAAETAAQAQAQIDATKAQTQAQIDAAKAQADAAKADADATRQQLEALQAKQTERGMVLTLGNNVLFDTNKAEVKPGATDAIDRVGQFLANHPNLKVRVEGHTDSTGTDSYNQELSERRADAVAHALESRGADRANVEAVGRGSELPVATNDTAAGRQQNRRVELVFSDAGGQFARAN